MAEYCAGASTAAYIHPFPDSGLLGDIAFTSEYSSTPLEVTGIATATGIALGGTHSCALLNDGKVMCWGTNYYGQLGT